MTIRMVEDIGAPVAVSAIDLITEKVAPEWNEWASYLMTAAGYVGGFMNFGGPFVKNLGVASLPLTVRAISKRIGITEPVRSEAASRLAFRPAAHPGIRQTVVPEFENVRVS